MVAAHLSRTEPKSYFVPGVDVQFADGTRGEADIFGISNARIIAGEVKTKSVDFTPEQLS